MTAALEARSTPERVPLEVTNCNLKFLSAQTLQSPRASEGRPHDYGVSSLPLHECTRGDPRYLRQTPPQTQHFAMADDYAGQDLRVMPNRSSLILGLICSGVFLVEFWAQGMSRWLDAFLGLVFLSCLFHILRPSPLILATREGLNLGIGTLGRSFFVPWNRVDGVVLTEVRSFRGYQNDALGFVILQDEEFKLPALRWNSASPDAGAPYSDVTFEYSMINGDVNTWVQSSSSFAKMSVTSLPECSGCTVETRLAASSLHRPPNWRRCKPCL